MTVKETTFVQDDRRYLIYANSDNGTNASCIVIEDEPGSYRKLLQELVNSDTCSLAAVLPFSDQSISLLNGGSFEYESPKGPKSISLASLDRCVAVIDMRNESGTSFEGEEDRALAGYYLWRKIDPRIHSFFATRYGSERFRKSGLFGAFGFVDLKSKGQFAKADLLPEDADLIISAVRLGLSKAFDFTSNSYLLNGNLIDICFKGITCSCKTSQPLVMLREVLRAGEKGISDRDLVAAVGVSRKATVEDAPEVDLGQIKELIREFGIAGKVDGSFADRKQAKEIYKLAKEELARIEEELADATQNAEETEADIIQQYRTEFREKYDLSFPPSTDAISELMEDEQEAVRSDIETAENAIKDARTRNEESTAEKQQKQKMLRKLRDEAYREWMGYSNEPEDKDSVIVRKNMTERIYEKLEKAKGDPEALIKHLQEHIVRPHGQHMTQYTGKEKWRFE